MNMYCSSPRTNATTFTSLLIERFLRARDCAESLCRVTQVATVPGVATNARIGKLASGHSGDFLVVRRDFPEFRRRVDDSRNV